MKRPHLKLTRNRPIATLKFAVAQEFSARLGVAFLALFQKVILFRLFVYELGMVRQWSCMTWLRVALHSRCRLRGSLGILRPTILQLLLGVCGMSVHRLSTWVDTHLMNFLDLPLTNSSVCYL